MDICIFLLLDSGTSRLPDFRGVCTVSGDHTQLYEEKKMSKRKATSNTMDEVVGLIVDWKAKDLETLRTKINELLMGKPMDIKFGGKMKFLKDILVVYDKGEADEGDIADIFADTVHNYILQWKDGDTEAVEIQIVNQQGVMYAGTTKFECQGLKVGPLTVVTSFPETRGGFRSLPEHVSGIEELCPILVKHGIDSEEKVATFVEWILLNVCDGPKGYLQSKLQQLFEEYSYEHCLAIVSKIVHAICVSPPTV